MGVRRTRDSDVRIGACKRFAKAVAHDFAEHEQSRHGEEGHMKLRTRRAGFIGRLAVAAIAGVLLLSGTAVTSAQASGSCSASDRADLWLGSMSVHLIRTTGCTYYARLVSDDPVYTAGMTINLRVERQEGGSITAWRQINIAGPYGTYNTAAVDGWWVGAASQDQHHACWAVNYGYWSCTNWVDA
jgi:hypothetical protein